MSAIINFICSGMKKVKKGCWQRTQRKDIQCERKLASRKKVCADCTKAFSSFCTILLYEGERAALDGNLIHKWQICYIVSATLRRALQNLVILKFIYRRDRFGKCFHTNTRNCFTKNSNLMFLSPVGRFFSTPFTYYY